MVLRSSSEAAPLTYRRTDSLEPNSGTRVLNCFEGIPQPNSVAWQPIAHMNPNHLVVYTQADLIGVWMFLLPDSTVWQPNALILFGKATFTKFF